MPKQYEAMRDKFAKDMPMKDAKAKAAAIYNSKHKKNPVTRASSEDEKFVKRMKGK